MASAPSSASRDSNWTDILASFETPLRTAMTPGARPTRADDALDAPQAAPPAAAAQPIPDSIPILDTHDWDSDLGRTPIWDTHKPIPDTPDPG